MPYSAVGMEKGELDTPALLLDMDRLERNIEKMAARCRECDVAWRPHTKGSKTPAIAHKLIAAGAIGGNSRGELVGLKTFGIGSVQKLLPVDDTFTLLLSVAKYYTPDGVEIQENGITPTVEVTATVLDPLAVPDEEDQQKDRQLDRAIEVLLNPEAAADKAA